MRLFVSGEALYAEGSDSYSLCRVRLADRVLDVSPNSIPDVVTGGEFEWFLTHELASRFVSSRAKRFGRTLVLGERDLRLEDADGATVEMAMIKEPLPDTAASKFWPTAHYEGYLEEARETGLNPSPTLEVPLSSEMFSKFSHLVLGRKATVVFRFVATEAEHLPFRTAYATLTDSSDPSGDGSWFEAVVMPVRIVPPPL